MQLLSVVAAFKAFLVMQVEPWLAEKGDQT